ncbi:MAG: Gfo/Idh/MocA family oxidoreductase, partial [Pirellulales bacterium]
KLLDEMGKDIDAVTVSTPDHMHAPASALAMHMGKACFTQKPLTRTIYEARKLGEIAREMHVATQMGNQGTASNSLRKTA